MEWILKAEGLTKGFTLHTQGVVEIPVLQRLELTVCPGESIALVGPSGAGKSTLLRLLYGNYVCGQGRILVRHRDQIVDMARATPHEIIDIRRWTMGYVSQFLRIIPRVSAIDVVAEPLRDRGAAMEDARRVAEEMLACLNIPRRLWGLSPTTFSGGEQQRINMARGFVAPYPIMVLDEPTASLDDVNKAVVRAMINAARSRGTAVISIFHDEADRRQVATRTIALRPMTRNDDPDGSHFSHAV
ncbi:MAG: phosphonate C-P lyase system protein PhnL [Deltaproteobacteria bacterium]|nr:phosphonate C-P lyase system protein PhnL [Deltaproteobacteria bacterium]